MITTVIFDYGNTLAHYDQRELSLTYADNEEDAAILGDVLFSRYYWDRLDDGSLSDKDWIADAKHRLPPHLHKTAEEVAKTWHHALPIIDGMPDIVSDLHRRGIKLYLLSNISRSFDAHKGEIEILRDFDGYLCSATIGVVKPDPKIYETLIRRYHLATNSCLFVDDRQENLDAAAKFGIHTYLFDGDSQKFAAYLETVL